MGTAIEVNHVWKKFNRGEFNDSLRDAIPALFKSLVGLGPSRAELQKNEFWALKDVDFKVEEGESVALIGHNGAGKSTLLKIFSKILKPNRGSIKVNGRMRALIEVGSGFHGDLTGRENIFLNGSILGMSRKEIQSKFDAIVDFAGIGEFLDMPVKRYSSGMYARLGFAVAAHLDPEILIVDEVLAVGDIAFQKKCLGKMDEVAHEGRTVIFVSHNMTAVRRLCKRAILFDHGELVTDGDSDSTVEVFFQLLTKHQKDWQKQTEKNKNRKAYITNILLGSSPDNYSTECFCDCNKPLYCRVFFTVQEGLNIQNISLVFHDFQEIGIVGFNTRITENQFGCVKPGNYSLDIYVPHFTLAPGVYKPIAALIEQEQGIGMPENRLSHFVSDYPLTVQGVDMDNWHFSRGYYQRAFNAYEWNLIKVD